MKEVYFTNSSALKKRVKELKEDYEDVEEHPSFYAKTEKLGQLSFTVVTYSKEKEWELFSNEEWEKMIKKENVAFSKS